MGVQNKMDEQGIIVRNKARLVAKRCITRKKELIYETYAFVVRLEVVTCICLLVWI